MFKGYTAFKRGFASRMINPRPDIPAMSLGIETAENKAPVSFSYLSAMPPPQAPNIPKVRNMDDILHDGQGPQVTEKDFPALYYIGDAL